MKKVILTSVLALSVISGCSKADDNTADIRESAWNSLSAKDKQEVKADWENAKVEVAKFSEMPLPKGGGKRVEVNHLFKVSFESNSDQVSGPIRVFVDGDTKKTVSYSKTVNPWNFKEGYVVAKEDSRVLVVRDKVDFEMPLGKILNDDQPNAIWLTVDKANYDVVSVGDQVSVILADGIIDLSYPAQAKANEIKKINSVSTTSKVVISNIPTAAVAKTTGFTEYDAISMVLKALTKGPDGNRSVDFPNHSGQIKQVEVTIGGMNGTKANLELKTQVDKKEDGTFVVTLTKDWNVKVGNKKAVSYWKYEVNKEGRIKLLKSEDNDKLIATIK